MDSKIPKVRFKDEQNGDYPDWKKTQLSDVADVLRGSGLSKSDLGDAGKHPCILYGELYTRYAETINTVHSRTNIQSKVTGQLGDILMPTSGETAEGVATASALMVRGVKIGGDIIIVRCQGETHPVFFSYILNSCKKQIMRLATGASVSHIYPRDILSLELVLPSAHQEQQKIADFLSTIDEKIDTLTRKKTLLEQYKRGVLQRLFSQELRFRDREGHHYPEWEQKKLGDILEYIQPTEYMVKRSNYDDSYKTPVLTAGKTFLLGYSNETDGIFVNPLPVIIFDDFTTAFKFVPFEFKVKSAALKILIPLHNVNLRFVYEAMKFVRFPRGEHKRYWISEFRHEKIHYPTAEEQQRVADFLSAVDEKIELVNSQIEKTQTFKQGLLQQLFV